MISACAVSLPPRPVRLRIPFIPHDAGPGPSTPAGRRLRKSAEHAAAMERRRRRKPPRLRDSVRRAYAGDRDRGVFACVHGRRKPVPEFNIARFRPASTRKRRAKRPFSGQTASFPDLYKFAVQVSPGRGADPNRKRTVTGAAADGGGRDHRVSSPDPARPERQDSTDLPRPESRPWSSPARARDRGRDPRTC